MFTIKRKLALFALSASLFGGSAAALAPAASAGGYHVNNIRACNNRCLVVPFIP
jgi:hypothetical protein